MSEKNDALRLADMLERMPLGECDHQAAAKLRQLHEENAELRKANDAFGQRQEWWNERMVALEAQRDALKQTLHDELAGNLRLRDLGGARPDEPMLTFLERIIAERDALLAALQELCDTLGECGMTEKARAAIKMVEEGE